eukprot:757297-Hanusia_phi.AAC.3
MEDWAWQEREQGIVDECPLVQGGWMWEENACSRRLFSERECSRCLLGGRGGGSVLFAGDSNCRDIFVEAASCVLDDWDPELPVAREKTKHSNSSVRLEGGGSLDFVWCTKIYEVYFAMLAMLEKVEASRAGGGGQGEGTERHLVVLGFSIWDMVVHLTPLSQLLLDVDPLIRVAHLLQSKGVAVMWLSPIPRTLKKKGMLAGERDVLLSDWRTRRWAERLADKMRSNGIFVVDSFHPAAALPEAFDGNHVGIACAWGEKKENFGDAGRVGVCKLNGRLVARTILNSMLNGICPTREKYEEKATQILIPDMLPATSSSFSPASSSPASLLAEDIVLFLLQPSKDEGSTSGAVRAIRREWPQGAVGEIRFSWCMYCTENLHHVVVLLDDVSQ